MRSRATKIGLALLGSVGALGVAALVPSCADDEDARRGGLGTSCVSTDDCEPPLACIENVCGGPGSTSSAGGHGGSAIQGGSGGASDGAGGQGAGAGGSGGSGGSAGQAPCAGLGESINDCDDCLDVECHDEVCACGGDCMAIEGCIESLCRSLVDQNESDCFVYCQNLHLAGKDAHIDVTWCSYYDTVCAPSCPGGYPQIYQDCRLAVEQGSCAAEWAACSGSATCLVYRDCTAACTTLQECLACSSTADGMAARVLYEAWETCVAYECISESWW